MKRDCFKLALILLCGVLITGCAHTVNGSVNIPSEPVHVEKTDHQADTADTTPEADVVEQGGPVSQASGKSDENESSYDDELDENGDEAVTIADPLEPWNRGVFVFNDKFYFWVMKPVTRAYSYVLPEDVRVIFKNFYQNITAPIRLVNNLLQLKMKSAGIELARFLINSTIGILGLADVAKTDFDLKVRDEDFGQTLGRYGLGHGIYIVWPFIGPSSIRDTVGLAGDLALHPLWGWGYSVSKDISLETSLTLTAHDYMNNMSFRLGDYEALKKAAIDPYIMMRNAYIQKRKAEVEK